MKARFIHTADWQLGKPFAGVEDDEKRALLRNERFAVLQRIAEKARGFQAEFVVVAGDLFDSPSATRATVSFACSAIGAMEIPVFAIPGNHDHGGPGSLWEQDFFRHEREQLAPNLRVLLEPEPVELPNAVLLPCPLLRRREAADPTAWLRAMEDLASPYADKPRIVLAHGSVQDFGALSDDEESDAGVANLIDLTRLPQDQFDYVALGDWHGTKPITAKAWYAGTPELDRFIKGEDHDPGNILAVEAERGRDPVVQRLETAVIGWHEFEFHFTDDAGLNVLEQRVGDTIGNWADRHLVRLHLSGVLGIDAASRLERLLESWKARLLRLKLENRTTLAPAAAELDALSRRPNDPLISRVAAQLIADLGDPGETGAIARTSLRELYAVCSQT